MPLYEYRCKSCGQKFSELSGVVADSQPPACTACGSLDLEKLVSGFRTGKDETQRVESAADALERTDPDDGQAVGDAVAEVGRAMDDDISSEMSEMFERDNE
ncbi:MAG: zinc ribbon domain-containing protein [Armatimonadetes bacterium]|nr:zinc ribbon domain-containing protein [Armatimonadota bacterium]